MRHVLILAAGLSLVSAAVHAQIDPVTGRPYGVVTPGMTTQAAPRQPNITRPLPSTQSTKPLPSFGPATLPPPPTFNPATAVRPPKLPQSPYADGQFSPAGEAKRERKENAIPQGGPFSPEGEAKRAAAQEKRDKANASPF